MAAPFYNAIKGTTAGTPNTGAFTPNAAASGFIAWSVVPVGWMGLVRYEEGTAWELSYGYWNGTTITRPSAGFSASSSGTQLSLTSASTASQVIDASDVQPHLIIPWRGYVPLPGSATSPTPIGLGAVTVTGTAQNIALAATNYLTEQPRSQSNSATTANAQAGYSTATLVGLTSTNAGRGGWEFTCRFGAAQLPTGPRLFVGLTTTTFVAQTIEPSAFANAFAVIGKDSTDTNLQFLTNAASSSGGTKIDTGIALAANGWYEVTIWTDPGSTTVKMLLFRLDTGDIYYGSTSTDVPANGSLLLMNCVGGLSGTTGTSFNLCMGGMFIRTGS
jgi:hypothetical protein